MFRDGPRPNGFQMTFENGWTISVQWSVHNYCSRRRYYIVDDTPGESVDAEIAIWDENDCWYDFGTDTVKGWVKADEVAEWISKVRSW